MSEPEPQIRKQRSGAVLVASGIFLSRLFGLIRERVFAYYFGNTDFADAFKAALRIPNFLQNLFGEGVLSASFIPVYARLLAEGREADARRLAGMVASLLFLVTALLALVGIWWTPLLIELITPGFVGGKRELAIELVRILFPAVGLLVMSAWCLGVLNSHRKFFLSYAAPVVWNIAIIAFLWVCGSLWAGGKGMGERDLVVMAAWGVFAGSLLQVAVQLPEVLKLLQGFRCSLSLATPGASQVLSSFFPVVVARGVIQVTAYVESLIASLLGSGAVAALAYAQTIYLLPISLFGMSVSAAELPAMSSVTGTTEEVACRLRLQLERGLRMITFFIVPTVAVFLLLGDSIIGGLFQTGRFTRADTLYVAHALSVLGLGLLASSRGRLYSSAFYALRDTRRPLYFALVRVAVGTSLGLVFALLVPRQCGVPQSWGLYGLCLGSCCGAWAEFTLLRRTLAKRIGAIAADYRLLGQTAGASLVGVLAAFLVRQSVGAIHPLIAAFFTLGIFGVTYLALTAFLKVPESAALLARLQLRR